MVGIAYSWKIYYTEGDETPPDDRKICYKEEGEDDDESITTTTTTTLLQTYQQAVPPEAFLMSDTATANTWHVKVFNAVVETSAQLAPHEGVLVCYNTSTLTSVYIYPIEIKY